MSLRLRLIVVFFLLSVVPLAALTLFSYANNARAVRDVARHEAELLAGELGQRMMVVTAQLSDRVEYLMNLADATEAVDTAVERSQALASAAMASSTAAANTATSASETLGSVAMLLNNVELRDFGRGRRGGGGGGRSGGSDGRGGRGADFGARGGAPGGAFTGAPTPPPQAMDGPAPGSSAAPGTPVPPSGPGSSIADSADRITIDMMPIRREIMDQYASQDDFAKLPETEKQRIIGEVNQRMLGIRMGIQMGTAEAQKRIADAQRAAEAKAKAAAASAVPVKADVASLAPLQRRATLEGSRLDVATLRDGQVVRRANADVDLQNLLGTVFSTTRRVSGEVPFAVAKDGKLYTPTDDDRKTVESIGGDVTKPSTAPGTSVVRDWIVVTVADPTGAGLKFGIVRPIGNSLTELRRTTARNAASGLGFICLALIGIVPLSARLTRNLSRLNDGVHRIAQGDYRARVEVRSKDEIGQLAKAFNQMAEDVEQHQRAAVGQERIRRELELGRQIQHDMLPHAPLRFGLTDIKGVSVPAREVGGDFFNYFRLSDGKVALFVGDVSGKGVGAALLMANIQASLRTRMALGQGLAAVAEELDVEIDANTPGSVYATLFIATLNVETYELRYVNAGHNPQYLLRAHGVLDQMPSTGMPIGLLSGHGYIEHALQLAPGDLLFFYTDGCVEAEAESGEMFGTDRLEALLKSVAREGADDALASVEASIREFRGTREPFDDATMMAVKIG